MFTLGIICGGPSLERGISLNSARILLDHVDKKNIHIQAYFVDQSLRYYQIPTAWLYSNTPADFDFKIQQVSTALNEQDWLTQLATCDLIFPVIHGQFGEDGTLAALLEQHNIPFVGNSAATCQQVYAKDLAYTQLAKHGFPTLAWLTITATTSAEAIADFWQTHMQDSAAIIKPSRGGSSLGVYKIQNIQELNQRKTELLTRYDTLVLQPYQPGPELTIVLLHNQQGEVVALPATETHLGTDSDGIFDYRSKYLPSDACNHFTPPRLSAEQLLALNDRACAIFKQLNLRDFARFDGYFCQERGFICNDINPCSGFEENSFFFKQATQCGFTHKSLLAHLIKRACARQQLTLPNTSPVTKGKQTVYVIMGGDNAERQVSLISGRNVWLKLLASDKYAPIAVFLDKKQRIWRLPYAMFLHHTCEEISHAITHNNLPEAIQDILISTSIKLNKTPASRQLQCEPLETFLAQIAKEKAPLFLGLHGGFGENGELQQRLEHYNIPFNGSGSQASQLCMDKYATQQRLAQYPHPHIQIIKQVSINEDTWVNWELSDAKHYWQQLQQTFPDSPHIIIKPQSEGCSSGVVILTQAEDLYRYSQLISNQCSVAKPNTFQQQTGPVELPTDAKQFIFEAYTQTDAIRIEKQQLSYTQDTGWLELTVVVRTLPHTYAFTPSITVSQGGVLSIEEKFQGGTGINLTPPPERILTSAELKHIQSLVCYAAEKLGIKQYARLDVFYHRPSQCAQIIEANTLPALTPSTVLFQQALAEQEPIGPEAFLESLLIQMQPDTQKVATVE